jgi:hypothetical protein
MTCADGVPRRPGVITASSFRFLYLIFDRLLGWLICSAAPIVPPAVASRDPAAARNPRVRSATDPPTPA